jgi:hypothetical protein
MKTDYKALVKKLGGPTKVAKELNCTRQTIHRWLREEVPDIGRYRLNELAEKHDKQQD